MSEVGERMARQDANTQHSNTGRIWAIVIIGAVVACCVLFSHYTSLPAEDGLFNVLILGEDRSYTREGDVVSAPGRMDTILVLSVSKNSRQVSWISIPRTREIPAGERRMTPLLQKEVDLAPACFRPCGFACSQTCHCGLWRVCRLSRCAGRRGDNGRQADEICGQGRFILR